MMTDLTTREIKGMSAKNLIWLLGCVITIEFTVIIAYSTMTNNEAKSNDRLNKIEQVLQKRAEKETIFEINQEILKTEIQALKDNNNKNRNR